MYAPNALWFYQLSLNNSDETITATSLSKNSLASGPFSFSVTVEGQPPSVKVSPDVSGYLLVCIRSTCAVRGKDTVNGALLW